MINPENIGGRKLDPTGEKRRLGLSYSANPNRPNMQNPNPIRIDTYTGATKTLADGTVAQVQGRPAIGMPRPKNPDGSWMQKGQQTRKGEIGAMGALPQSQNPQNLIHAPELLRRRYARDPIAILRPPLGQPRIPEYGWRAPMEGGARIPAYSQPIRRLPRWLV